MEPEKAISAAAAQERARHVADRVRKDKNKQAAGRRDSIASDDSHDSQAISEHSYHGESIPLRLMAHGNESQQALITPGTPEQRARRSESIGRDAPLKEQALKLVRAHTRRFRRKSESETSSPAEPVLGATQSHATPSEVNNGIYDGVYTVPPPKQYRSSVLSQLLRLYKPNNEVMSNHGRNWSSSTLGLHAHQDDGGEAGHGGFSGGSSGAATPTRRKWYEQNKSHDTLANLVGASARLANPNLPTPDPTKPGPGRRWSRPTQHRRRRSSSNHMAAFLGRDEENRIAVHIAETLARQDYIVKLCQALMLYGAPTHRLEEYLSMTARALEIDGQFLYIPGSMVISFDDRSTHTAEVRMVRVTQGIDLGKLKDVHHVYKEVIHDVITIEEAIQTLDKLMQSPDKFNAWLRVFIFGLTSATAAPFSFNARLIDLPLCFFFGCLVGFLQLIVSPKSNLYSNVFEVSAVVLVSFLARVFGSLSGGNLFCFSALAQGGIVMLLPGYLVCKLHHTTPKCVTSNILGTNYLLSVLFA